MSGSSDHLEPAGTGKEGGIGVNPPSCSPLPYLKQVLYSSILWTVGSALTSGGFLTYFAAEVGIRDRRMAIFLALPELVGGLAVLTRSVDWGFRNRKQTWIVCSLLARLFLLGIPHSIFFTASPDASSQATLAMLVALGMSSILQAMANVAWLSWMSEVFPRSAWGRLIGLRNIAMLGVLLTVPVGVGYLRDAIRVAPPFGTTPGEVMRLFYLVAFVVGNLIILISMWPLLAIPRPADSFAETSGSSRQVFWDILRRPGFRSVVWFHWWHAFWSGMTQAAFFDYRYHHLHIGLGTYYLLEASMRLVQIPVCHWSGRCCDRRRTRQVLAVGIVAISGSLPFWMLSTAEEWWWIWGAYLLWGAWGTINVAGPTLSLQHAPEKDNTLHLAIADRGAGMCAGIAGLMGGILLADWSDSATASGGSVREVFMGIFAIGMAGRLSSLYWLWKIAPSDQREATAMESVPVAAP